MEKQEYLISTSGRMDDVKQRNIFSCPFMRAFVPASSNCLTWAFTLPILMSPLDCLPCSGEKGKSNITLKGNATWKSDITSQLRTSETQLQNLLYMEPGQQCLCSCSGHGLCVPEASLGFGSAGHDSCLWEGSAPRGVGWGEVVGEEGSSVLLGQGTWWCWASQHPPTWQRVPVTKNKDSFGVVVRLPRRIIFAALRAPPDRGEAVSKHSFFLGLGERCRIVGTLWEFL